ncbi:hypothetical protein I79_006866 [Cricetulus griseus]|uniref:Uncharacterized protein n=1 Tax=Cricetulus griseus TaxID=10029 RepID=G3H906_CRIGR|nr:hypothetical protein I79_006866 [Cricetulus griseus]
MKHESEKGMSDRRRVMVKPPREDRLSLRIPGVDRGQQVLCRKRTWVRTCWSSMVMCSMCALF